jgi:hypothetical protein
MGRDPKAIDRSIPAMAGDVALRQWVGANKDGDELLPFKG